MASYDVRYVVTFDDTGAIKKIQDFDKAIEDLGKTTNTKATPAFGGLWKQIMLGEIATGALRKGFREVKDQILESVKAAMEAERIDKSLDAALEITGRSAANLAEHFKEYAAQLQRVTVYDDEAVKKTQALLVQLTNLDKNGIDRATRGAIGLASVFTMDLTSAAELVSKAMAGNIGALSRYGIRVAENLPLEEKRNQLMAQLEKMFGRATAETNTFSGQLSQLKNRWGEVQEAAGKWITQQRGVVEILNKASQTLLDYLTMADMLDSATRKQVEQENRLADRLGKAAAAANWQYREMANLIESYNFNFAAIIRDINAGKLGTEIKEAYIAVLRKEKAEWVVLEAARKKAEKGTNDMGVAVKITTKLINSELVAVQGLAHALYRLGTTELPPPKGLPEAQAQWLGLKTEVSSTADVWDMAIQSMTANLVSFGDANASVWENIGNVFGSFVKQAIAGLEALWIRQILISKGIIKAKQGEATASHISNIFKSVPFPLDLILAAGAFAVINALFAKLFKFERGGYFNKPTYLPGALVGEAGPEFILPERKLEAAVQRAIGGRGRDGTLAGAPSISYAITIKGPVLATTAALTDDMISAASGKLFTAIENQARIRGRRLF